MDTVTILTLIGLAAFLIGSALSSAIETAVTSVSRLRVRQRIEEGDKKAVTLEKILEHPSNFLGTILFLNNLFNIAAASSATVLAEKYVPYPAAIATGVMTFLILIFGEISPKTFAVQRADKIAFIVAPIVDFLQKILKPVVRLLIIISNGLIKIFGAKVRKEGPFVTEEEIKTLVSVGEEEGIIEKHEREMIDSIFEFGDTVVKEVMIPRMDMTAVEKDSTVEKVFETIVKKGYSRIPVYENTIDNVIGIVYTRDLLIHSAKQKGSTIKPLIKPAYYVPETKKVMEFLRELQKAKVHMAIVVDEYGGTAGLVTIEDLLEEIVGEIFDEYDPEEVLIEKMNKNSFKVNAKVNIGDINKKLNLNLPEAEYESLGGFVINLFEKIPSPGDKIAYNGITFTIDKIIRRRISRLVITKKEEVKNE